MSISYDEVFIDSVGTPENKKAASMGGFVGGVQ
jgi:hypothetical protein